MWKGEKPLPKAGDIWLFPFAPDPDWTFVSFKKPNFRYFAF